MAHVSLPYTITGCTSVSYISVLTALLTALDLNICLRLQKQLLPAVILDFISSPIKFFECIKVAKYLKFWTPSNTCRSRIRSCYKFVIFLLISMHFALLVPMPIRVIVPDIQNIQHNTYVSEELSMSVT